MLGRKEPVQRDRCCLPLESGGGWRKNETSGWFSLVGASAFEFPSVLWW